MAPGDITLAEIKSQPETWRAALDIVARHGQEVADRWATGGYERVLLTGCGSTYYLSVIGSELLRAQLGITARAYPATELLLYPDHYLDPGQRTLLLTVSRSGVTRETRAAVSAFRQYGKGETAAICCYGESGLVADVDWSLVVNEAREESRVQTRSFSSMTVLAQAVAALGHLAPDVVNEALAPLPEITAGLLADYEDLARQLGGKPDTAQYMFLGSGVRYGLACEAMLKMMEMSVLPSMAFQPLEFLHGPRYVINPQTIVVALLDGSVYDEEVRALEEARQRGATVLALTAGTAVDGPWDHRVTLPADLPAWVRPVLYLPVLQLLGFYQARARGRNPDHLV
ncbi:MAG: SIS domain-containing protein [Anaerolineae bacterium]|nr:SIS domain-containing protein [Anaerolineae bacterium]